jgi:hypothetical protein
MTERCSHCSGTQKVDETTNAGQWIKVDCPVCTKPRTRDEYEAKKQEMRELLASLKGYKPAWMNVS